MMAELIMVFTGDELYVKTALHMEVSYPGIHRVLWRKIRYSGTVKNSRMHRIHKKLVESFFRKLNRLGSRRRTYYIDRFAKRNALTGCDTILSWQDKFWEIQGTLAPQGIQFDSISASQ